MSKEETVSDAQVEKELQEPIEIKPAKLALAGIKSQIRIPVKTECLIDGGTTKMIKWAITVKRCTVEEHDSYMKAVVDGAMSDFEVAKEVILDWHLLKTVDNQKVLFSEENLMGVFEVPEYKKSITSAIYDVMSGGARKKMFK